MNEITPPEITGQILALCDDLGAMAPLYLNVSPAPEARMGWCSTNVLDQCRKEGGRPLYGWLLWEASGLYLNAEFHCVWRDGQDLHDITPTQEGETCVLFAPDPRYAADFDFKRRPNNRRFRSYGWAEREPLVRAKLGEASGSALEYRRRRAEKKSVTLRQMILSSLPRDRLEMLIDEFLFAAGRTDGMLTVTERGTECLAPNSVAEYRRRVFEINLMRKNIFKMADRAVRGTTGFSL
ncbi:MAG: hypothetical protein J0H42_20510 [Rhizobiales bacterium]|nr:hypothetical protein [Hyphomicrobiales bacterium]